MCWAEGRAGNRLKGGGLPPSPLPPPHCPDSTPKAFPSPGTSPQPHLQPPETASPNRFHIPCDRSAAALGRSRCPPPPPFKRSPGAGGTTERT